MERLEKSVGQIGDMVKALLAAQGRPMHEAQRQKWEGAKQPQGGASSRQRPPQRQSPQGEAQAEPQGAAQYELAGELREGNGASRSLPGAMPSPPTRENSVQSFRDLRKSVRALQLSEAASKAMFSPIGSPRE